MRQADTTHRAIECRFGYAGLESASVRKPYLFVLGCLLVELAAAAYAYLLELPDFDIEVGFMAVSVGLASFVPVSRVLNGRWWGPPRVDKGWELLRAAPVRAQVGLALLLVPYMVLSLVSLVASAYPPIVEHASTRPMHALGTWLCLASTAMLRTLQSQHRRGIVTVSAPRPGSLRPLGVIGFLIAAFFANAYASGYYGHHDSPQPHDWLAAEYQDRSWYPHVVEANFSRSGKLEVYLDTQDRSVVAAACADLTDDTGWLHARNCSMCATAGPLKCWSAPNLSDDAPASVIGPIEPQEHVQPPVRMSSAVQA